jgi:SP family arabinose:H+ symporter-like MFS transporter
MNTRSQEHRELQAREGRHLGFLIFICLAATAGGLLFGYDMIVVSGTQEQVARQFHLSSSMQGQFTNMAVIGCLLGVLSTIVLGDRISRKSLLVSSSFLLFLAAIGCGLSRSWPELFFARWLGGVGVGIASVISPLYIAEVSPASFRGRMVTLFQLMINLGILAAAVINAGLEMCSERAQLSALWMRTILVDEVWRAMFLVQALPGLGFFLLCLLLPHSPRWLIKEGRYSAAKSVLGRIRQCDEAQAEFEEIREAVMREDDRFGQLFEGCYFEAIKVGLFLSLIGDLSGITAVFYYGPGILNQVGLGRRGSLAGFIVISLFIVLGTLLASWLIDLVGRKPLLYSSTSGCMVSLLGTGLLLLGGRSQGSIIVALICAFVLFFGIGLGPIKFVIISEIFPTKLRGRASAVCTMGLWTSVSLVASLFPVIRDGAGMAICFLLFGIILMLTFPLLILYVPETKGRTLESLEMMWSESPVCSEDLS